MEILNKHDEALEYYQKALKLKNTNPYLHGKIAGIYLLQKDNHELARKHFDLAIIYGSKDCSVYVNYSKLKSLYEENKEALELCKTSLEFDNNSEATYEQMGNILTELKEYESAKTNLKTYPCLFIGLLKRSLTM